MGARFAAQFPKTGWSGIVDERGMVGKQLVEEVKNQPCSPLDDITVLELLTFIHKQPFEEFYPNLWVALWVACTCDWGLRREEFLKAEAHQHLPKFIHRPGWPHGLTIISINHEMGKQLSLYFHLLMTLKVKNKKKSREADIWRTMWWLNKLLLN